MDHTAALHRIQVGVPATVEHSSEAGPETGKWIAQTTSVSDIFIFCWYDLTTLLYLRIITILEIHHLYGRLTVEITS